MATLDAHEDEVYGIEVLSNEGLLAVGAGDTVQLWDLNTATRSVQATLAAKQGGLVLCHAWLPVPCQALPCRAMPHFLACDGVS